MRKRTLLRGHGYAAARAVLALFLLAAASVVMARRPAQDVRYGLGNWDPESGLGNHRAIVRVPALSSPQPAAPAKGAGRSRDVVASAKPAVVQVRIPWRRRDLVPEKKAVIVVDAATGERVRNVLPLAVTREFGFLLFEPKTVPGDYFVYYHALQVRGPEELSQRQI